MSDDCQACNATYAQGNLRKRLIVCCDGTSYGVDKGTADYASNVGRISRAISRVGVASDGEKVSQVVYYQSGVGTGSLTSVDRARQGAFGASLAENVCEAYNYLANNWGPGDEIFLFGFSRGAYTARSLAGFICQVGLLMPIHMDHFHEVYSAYKNRGDAAFQDTPWATAPLEPGELGTVPPQAGAPAQAHGSRSRSRLDHLRSIAHTHVKIKVVGVWDTVGSLSVVNWFGQAGDDAHFHSTKLSPKVENAFHALALDESRGNFPPTLWHLDSTCLGPDGTPMVNLKQCWFPGYHSDVGGQKAGDLDANSIDEITFSWMCDQLHGLLQLSGTVLQKYILFRLGDTNFDLSNKKIRDLAASWTKIGWANGKLSDTNSWTAGWWVPSLLSTAKASYKRVPGETKAFEKVNGTTKQIPCQNFREEVHPSVYHRYRASVGYKPAPFAGDEWTYHESKDGKPAQWVKTLKGGQQVVLNEYLIPRSDKMKAGYRKAQGYDHWEGSLERTFAPKEVLEVQDLCLKD
ncbi:uncharacterized protein UV8b_01147 [Ustilaginoidea virens]|uniref:T6SS Phospholipase effector Tle1-like catalytic domain-containing protein n=1 Tax=Ustilaginoidea virens TaxID=1159556 RepID=A0A063C6W5_USTVR|nr:uncharacterized protein UV8b_01147 [Ustilaginoidea virens]QUC16906.1 hypothetical protein UV8b_01147 [Ustilaginoidea virens]GAO19021.1 hypothetical protein UVI_02036280 [Ustilaginoidea virens]